MPSKCDLTIVQPSALSPAIITPLFHLPPFHPSIASANLQYPHHSTTTRSLSLQTPSKYLTRIKATSLSILTDASITLNFDPSTSLHSTPTSPVLIFSRLQRKKSSTSKANRSMWRVLNSRAADSRVNSLNPHCVSLVLMPRRRVMMALKTAETNLRWNLRSTLPYYSRWRRDPTTMTRGWVWEVWISLSFDQTLSSSENVVAPSASTINTQSPRAAAIPALTAPPLPRFLGYSTTIRGRERVLACARATEVVASLEPSLAMMTSKVLPRVLKQTATSASMAGRRASSLQLGTTSEMSGILVGRARYSGRVSFFPEARVIEMGAWAGRMCLSRHWRYFYLGQKRTARRMANARIAIDSSSIFPMCNYY